MDWRLEKECFRRCEQTDGIVFRGGEWAVGGEYVQKLTVKNVTTKMKKLKYRLPSTRYFSLAFPQTIELPPGMSTEIDVVFRPIQMETYDDTIYFKLEELALGATSDAPYSTTRVCKTLTARTCDGE